MLHVWNAKHDQVLERRGFRSLKHSTHRRPISQSLAKKAKYCNVSDIEPVLHPRYKPKDLMSLKLPVSIDTLEEYQAMRLCRGDQLRVTCPNNVM